MTITTLIENTAAWDDLIPEHGLSLYIETARRTILFDTGQSGAFADNAQKLGIDLNRVDLCILSHGHYDHGGGLMKFLELNDHAPVYISRHAFGEHFSSGKYIGLHPALEGNPRLIPTADIFPLEDGMTLYSCNHLPRPCSFGTFGQTVRRQGSEAEETYLHEQYLLLEEEGQRICFSGCSHKGVLNILHWLSPDVFLGGFHFIRMDPEGRELADAARQLAAVSTQYYTGHCTGQPQFDVLKRTLGHRLTYLHTGTVVSL